MPQTVRSRRRHFDGGLREADTPRFSDRMFGSSEPTSDCHIRYRTESCRVKKIHQILKIRSESKDSAYPMRSCRISMRLREDSARRWVVLL